MNTWMNDERERIARQYVHDMIHSFVTEKESEGLKMTSVYAPHIEQLLEIACCSDNYATKHRELNPFCVSNYYDIDGHCVHSLNGMAIVYIRSTVQSQLYSMAYRYSKRSMQSE